MTKQLGGNVAKIQRKQKRKFFRNWINDGSAFFLKGNRGQKITIEDILIDGNFLYFTYPNTSNELGALGSTIKSVFIPTCSYDKSTRDSEQRCLTVTDANGDVFVFYRAVLSFR